jgi:replicative DNA helicase
LITQAEMDGKILFSMREALSEWRSARSQPGIKLGFSQLDAAIMPGLYPGSLTILLARTGTGKSVILSNIAYNTRDVPTMTVTLENTKTQVVEHLQRVIRFEDPLIDEAGVNHLMCNWAVADPNRLTLKLLEDLIEVFAAENHGVRPRLLLIDHLAYMAQGQPGYGTFYEKTTQALFALKEMAKTLGLAIICPSQVNRQAEPGKPISMDDARDAGTIAETADFILLAWRPGMAVEGHREDGELVLELAKSRAGNTGKRFKALFSAHSLRMVDQTAPRDVLDKIRLENEHYNQSQPYDTYFARQRQAAWERQQLTLKV